MLVDSCWMFASSISLMEVGVDKSPKHEQYDEEENDPGKYNHSRMNIGVITFESPICEYKSNSSSLLEWG